MESEWLHLMPKLSTGITDCVASLKFSSATPVQAATIPLFTSNKDVAVEAVTGSGKTLAFIIPIIEILNKRVEKPKKKEVGAIILTPTRELAVQINDVLVTFLRYFPHLTQILMIGGQSPTEDINNFKENGGSIIIATPGRLEDLLTRQQDRFHLAAAVKSLEVLVLDEADRLLDMGFEASINNILSFLPKQRRTGLFSATQTKEVEALIRAGLRNPVRLLVKEKTGKNTNQKTPAALGNYYMICEADQKLNYLVDFLQCHYNDKLLVFFSTCACVDYFSKILQHILKNVAVLSIHGKIKGKRKQIIDTFRKMNSGLLVCTDVMARGIDLPDVNWVLQFDPPSASSAFVHRCGRTARIGNKGNALIFLLPTEDSFVNFLAINQKVPLSKIEAPRNVPILLNELCQLAVKDREIYEKGKRAFVSYIQSYTKHECYLIFRIKDLDIAKVAQCFGLLHLPKMPELKGKTFPDFTPQEIDTDTIPYRDKLKEKQRKKKRKLVELKEGNSKKKFKQETTSWSKQKERTERKARRRNRQDAKTKEAMVLNDGELEELAQDAKLVKKLKNKQISAEQFSQEFDLDDQ